jgi:hypothetical protein
VPTPDAPCVDNDSDGYPTSECGGMAPDCDDSNPMRNPGRTEVCDSMGVDEDCNPCTVAGASDGDGDRDTFLGAGCFNRYAGAAPMSCGPAVRIDGAMLRVVGATATTPTTTFARTRQMAATTGMTTATG